MTRHMYLTGFRGTGKSSVGGALATRLGRNVVDLDDVIEQQARLRIDQIFAKFGEDHFRNLESTVLRVVAATPPCVIALGGGTILAAKNRKLIAQTGYCVWLTADVEAIVERISADRQSATRRPPLTDRTQADEARELLRRREPLYRASANAVIDTNGKSVKQITDEIMRLRAFGFE